MDNGCGKNNTTFINTNEEIKNKKHGLAGQEKISRKRYG